MEALRKLSRPCEIADVLARIDDPCTHCSNIYHYVRLIVGKIFHVGSSLDSKRTSKGGPFEPLVFAQLIFRARTRSKGTPFDNVSRVRFSANESGLRIEGMLIGYARVSTDEQNLAMQLDALRAAGCQQVFFDEGISGTETERRALNQMLTSLNAGECWLSGSSIASGEASRILFRSPFGSMTKASAFDRFPRPSIRPR